MEKGEKRVVGRGKSICRGLEVESSKVSSQVTKRERTYLGSGAVYNMTRFYI